jgi:hypothetical protein
MMTPIQPGPQPTPSAQSGALPAGGNSPGTSALSSQISPPAQKVAVTQQSVQNLTSQQPRPQKLSAFKRFIKSRFAKTKKKGSYYKDFVVYNSLWSPRDYK